MKDFETLTEPLNKEKKKNKSFAQCVVDFHEISEQKINLAMFHF